MNQPPTGTSFHTHVINSFCDDLIDIASGKTTRPDRTNALREINKARKP